MKTKLTITSLILATATILTAVAPAQASRNTCKKVYMSAQNSTGGVVKVIDLDYDISGYGKKSEPIRNQEIPNGRTWGTERNLEQASGRSVSIIVKYRTKKNKGFGKWSGVKRAVSGYKNCRDGKQYSVVMR
jgi:hypothetical protein